MPLNYVDTDGRNIWTTMNPVYFMNQMCVTCANTVLREASFLCDCQVSAGKTCDAPICKGHAHRLAHQVEMEDAEGKFVDDVHVCPVHFAEWERDGRPEFWKLGGGV